MNFRRTNFRKAYLTALAVAMGASPAVTVLNHATVMAANENEAASTKKEISVTGVESGATVKAYQIIGGDYTTGGKLKSYHFNHISETDGLGIDSFEKAKTSSTVVAPTEDEIASIAKAVRNADDALGDVTPYAMTEDSTAKGTYKTTVAPGMYLVLVTNAKTHTYNPAIVSVNVTDSNDASKVSGSIQDLTKEFKVNDTTAYIKSEEIGGDDNEPNTPDPSKPDQTDEKGNNATKRTNFDMKITNGSVANTKYGDTVSPESTVNYEITANIPSYSKMMDSPKFTVTDTLASTLTRTGSTTVSVGGVKVDSTNYTLTEEAHKIVVDFKADYLSSLRAKASADRKLVITYSAKVAAGNSANVNTHDNESSAMLEYTSDKDTTKTLYANNHAYTFSIDTDSKHIFHKVNENGNALAGATFGIYGSLDGANGNTASDLVSTIDGAGTASKGETVTTDVSTSDTNGNLAFTGLNDDTDYYVKEISAPTGYTLSDAVYKVHVSASLDSNGLLSGYSVKVTPLAVTNGTAAETDDGAVTYTYDASGTLQGTTAPTQIQNTKMLSLPTTGARGALLITLFSSVGLGAVLLYKKKESDKKENEK